MANPSLQIGNSNWAIKEDNLLGYSTAGTRFVPQPITMTRASAGTRVNSSGLVETVELLGSEEVVNGDFNNGTTDWTVTGSGTASIVDDALNYSNTVNGSWFAQFISQAVSFVQNKIYKVTFKAKNISGSVNLRITHQSHIVFNNNLTSSFVDYTVYYTAQANNDSIRIFCNDAIGEFQIDNVSVKESTKNNLARVDYDGTASSLLVEPERTNLITYSNNFTDSSWLRVGSITTTDNYTTSPSGQNNATRLQWTNATNYIYQSLPHFGSDFTLSIYLKSNTDVSQNVRLFMDNGAQGQDVVVTTQWQRFELTNITTPTQSNRNAGLIKSGSQVGDLDISIWNAQFEEGSYPTSIIPTDGGTVTRVADQYSKTGISNLIGQTEGVIFLDFEIQTTNLDMVMMNIYNEATPSNCMYFYLNASNILYAYCDNSGTQVAISDLVVLAQGRYKAAFSYKANDFKFYLNGDLMGVDISGTVPTCSGFRLENYFASPIYQEKTQVNHAQLYKTTLTDSELIALTTI